MQIVAMVTFFIGLLLYRNKKLLVLFCLAVAIMLLRVYETWKFKENFTSCVFNVYTGWAFTIYGLICYSNCNIKRQKRLLAILLTLVTITAITTIIGLQKYPLAVRESGRNTTSYSGLTGSDFALVKWKYRIRNISGWNQLYGMVPIIPSSLFLAKKTGKLRFLMISLICTVTVFMSQLTYAVLLTGGLIVFLFLKPSKNGRVFFIQIFALLVILIILLNINSFLLTVVNFTSQRKMTMLSRKIYDLYLFLQGTTSGGALARINLYSKSWDLFKQHPVIGEAIWGVNSKGMFSNHSDLFDMLGYYGLFGLMLVISGCFMYWRFIKRVIKKEKWLSFILLGSLLAMYTFNPIWYSPQFFIGVFMMPALIVNTCNKSVYDKALGESRISGHISSINALEIHRSRF